MYMYIYIYIYIYIYYIFYLHITIVAIFTIAHLALAHHLRHVKNICCIFVSTYLFLFSFFSFVSFALIILFRSFVRSHVPRRYFIGESIIVCINIIPLSLQKNENAPDTSVSKRPVRVYVHVSLDPVAWNTPPYLRIDRSFSKEQEYLLSSSLSLSLSRTLIFLPLYLYVLLCSFFFFISNFIIHGRHLHERSCTYFNVFLTRRRLRISIIFFDY